MTTPDEIRDQIDHVLDDWEGGPDAMRWTPDPAPADDSPTVTEVVHDLFGQHPPPSLRGHRRGATLDWIVFDESHFALTPRWWAALAEVVNNMDAALRVVRRSIEDSTLSQSLDTFSVGAELIAAEALRAGRRRPPDRFTLNDWAVQGPTSDRQRALIREASE